MITMTFKEKRHEKMRLYCALAKSDGNRLHFNRLVLSRAKRCGVEKLQRMLSVLEDENYHYLAEAVEHQERAKFDLRLTEEEQAEDDAMEDGEVSREDFEKYVACQMSGVINMYAVNVVEEITGLTREKITAIMENYGEYEKKYS